MVDDRILRRIRANRRRVTNADAELPQLVRDAFDAGHTWQQIGKALGVGKARVYQLRAQGAEK